MGRFRKIETLSIERKIKDKPEYFKCLLVLSLQNVTFEAELKDKFDIRNNIITDFIDSMKNENFILVKDFCSIDDLLYETILRINPLSFYNTINKTGVLILTGKGKNFCKKILEESVKLQDENIVFTINEITNKVKAFKQAYDDILNKNNKTYGMSLTVNIGRINYLLDNKQISEEEKKYYNHLLTKDLKPYSVVDEMKRKEIIMSNERNKILKLNDNMISRNTNQILKQEINQGILDLKKDILLGKQKQGTLTHKESKQIALSDDSRRDLILLEQSAIKEKENVYKGLYSHLNSVELDNVINGVTKEEEREVFNEIKEETKYKMNIIKEIGDKDYYKKILNRREETPEEETKRNRECLDFINNLYQSIEK